MFSWFSHTWRLLRVAVTLLRYDALLPKEYQDRMPLWIGPVARALRLFSKRRHIPRGQRLAEALEKLGPAYVKFGQFLATRPDMIGVTAAQDLGRLKDRLPAFSRERALDTINAEFGKTVELFSDRFSDAMAAASIAQVHQALPDREKPLAVKILRPRIERKMAKEMAALRFGAGIVEFFFDQSRRLEPVKFVDTVSTALERELDLRLEAGAAAEFKEVAEKDGFLHVPEIDWSRSGKRVMTLQWIEGVPLTDRERLIAANADLHELAIKVTRGFLAAALDHGFFHADMHEGNMLFGNDGKLWIVDFGIMGRIGHKERRYLAEILYGFLRRDYKRIAEVHSEAGYVPEKFTVEEFAQALRAIGEPIFGKTADQVSMSRLLLQLFDVTHLFGMHLRPELVLLQKTMVQVEGVARALDPKHDMWAAARPIVERWVRRELGAESIAKRAIDEAGGGLAALRRLPQTLAALEGAANAFRAAPAPVERMRFQWRHFWVGAVSGVLAMLLLMLMNQPDRVVPAESAQAMERR